MGWKRFGIFLLIVVLYASGAHAAQVDAQPASKGSIEYVHVPMDPQSNNGSYRWAVFVFDCRTEHCSTWDQFRIKKPTSRVVPIGGPAYLDDNTTVQIYDVDGVPRTTAYARACPPSGGCYWVIDLTIENHEVGAEDTIRWLGTHFKSYAESEVDAYLLGEDFTRWGRMLNAALRAWH